MYVQDFVREILREQPENVYNFGARYFAELSNPAVRMNLETNPTHSNPTLSPLQPCEIVSPASLRLP